MNSIGKFREEEIDGKQYFVYYLDNFAEPATSNNEFSFKILFQCPWALFILLQEYEGTDFLELHYDSRFYDFIEENESLDDDIENHVSFDHPVLPLHWCNNKNGNPYDQCGACPAKCKVGSDYYFCSSCDKMFHKECVESPVEIKHPFHLLHNLKLFVFDENVVYCAQCGKSGELVYHCTLCDVSIHPLCALKSIPLVIDQPKRHNHLLNFFTRKRSLDCNVCNVVNSMLPTYVCVKCDFVAHNDCANFPTVIRISRHHHRISFVTSLLYGKWSCGVCRKDVDSEYGAYTCNKCDGYIVHSKCALRRDIWDGKELEGIPDDIEEVVDPFERISDGIILHFCHDHYLKLETKGEVYDGNQICDACVIPIYEGDYYSCMECDFILHDKCANAPRKIQHPSHPHPLTLKVTGGCISEGYFQCDICLVSCSGFRYECSKKGRSCFKLDIRCGSISEPFDYQGHEHPLFLALNPQERKSCQGCQVGNRILLNCIECDFIRCFECVTLPYMVRYKHDKHFLELGYREEANEPDWCEICEKHIFLGNHYDRRFYECKQCCITIHLRCLLGNSRYIKPGHILNIRNNEVQILPNNSLSRPICDECHERCVHKLIFKTHNNTFCSLSDAFLFR